MQNAHIIVNFTVYINNTLFFYLININYKSKTVIIFI